MLYPSNMIHLIGVDHIVQHEGFMNPRKRALISEFQSIVRDICSARDIHILAEEFNEEARQNSHVNRTVLENIAVEFDITHCFIEPGSV